MFKSETEMVTLNLEELPAPSVCSSSLSTASHSETSRPSLTSTQMPSIFKMWAETFQVPWDNMPPEIRTAISTEKRPKPAERRQMVRVLVDEMRKFDLSPTRAQCLTICQRIVREYPNTFGDKFPNGSLIGGGYTSLLLQVKARVENLNRESSFVCHRAKPNSGCKRGPTDTYGCVRFEPQPPPEETAETIESKRQRLQDIYCHEGTGGVERAENVQRQSLSTSRTNQKIKKVKDVLSQPENTEMAHMHIKLLMSHFQEHEDELVLHADVAASAADVGKKLDLPASPRLILLGMAEQTDAVRWMISLEGSFLTAFATLFAVYYVFNLQYQEGACCTLEFLQRSFGGINPERASKTCRGKVVSKKTGKVVNKKSATVNPKVASLLKNLVDFEWDFI
ncbi:uncharacterized protein LOC117824412, partial [Tachysurus ichikawai]